MPRLPSAAWRTARAATTAYGDISEPRSVTYGLVSVNGRPLPAALPRCPGIEVVSGGLHRHRDDVLAWVQLRIAGPHRAGSTCVVDDSGHVEYWGIYDARTSRLYVGDGAYFGMRFDGPLSATIHFDSGIKHQFRYMRQVRT